MRISRNILAVTCASVVAAGAAAAQSSGAATEVMGRWSASFKPSMSTGGSINGSGMSRPSGNVSISPSKAGSPGSFKVDIRFALQINGGPGGDQTSSPTYFWGVVPGHCGQGGIPVTQPGQNATIELSAAGVGEVSVDAPLNLKAAEQYHLNVYDASKGDRDEAITSCADLKYSAK